MRVNNALCEEAISLKGLPSRFFRLIPDFGRTFRGRIISSARWRLPSLHQRPRFHLGWDGPAPRGAIYDSRSCGIADDTLRSAGILGRAHEHAARQGRQDQAPPALRSPYGKPRAGDAHARFGGALELGGTDFGCRAVRRRSGRHCLQDGERGGAGGAGMGGCHGAAAGGRRPRATGLAARAYIDCPGHPPDRKHNGDTRRLDRSADLLGPADR